MWTYMYKASHTHQSMHTGVKKALYLETISTVVQYFRQFQNKNASSPFYGKIIDPYAGLHACSVRIYGLWTCIW